MRGIPNPSLRDRRRDVYPVIVARFNRAHRIYCARKVDVEKSFERSPPSNKNAHRAADRPCNEMIYRFLKTYS